MENQRSSFKLLQSALRGPSEQNVCVKLIPYKRNVQGSNQVKEAFKMKDFGSSYKTHPTIQLALYDSMSVGPDQPNSDAVNAFSHNYLTQIISL